MLDNEETVVSPSQHVGFVRLEVHDLRVFTPHDDAGHVKDRHDVQDLPAEVHRRVKCVVVAAEKLGFREPGQPDAVEEARVVVAVGNVAVGCIEEASGKRRKPELEPAELVHVELDAEPLRAVQQNRLSRQVVREGDGEPPNGGRPGNADNRTTHLPWELTGPRTDMGQLLCTADGNPLGTAEGERAGMARPAASSVARLRKWRVASAAARKAVVSWRGRWTMLCCKTSWSVLGAVALAVGLGIWLGGAGRVGVAPEPDVAGKTVEQLAKEGYWGRAEQWPEHEALLGQPAPPLNLTEWHNGELIAESLKGKIVVVDFWATWCGPCIASIPKNNKLAEEFRELGVLLIGACGSRGQEKMRETAEKHGMTYPTARVDDATLAAWKVGWFPTYAVIDQRGILRATGLNPAYVRPLVMKLLEESK